MAKPRRLRQILAIGLLLSLVVVSCGGSDRPTVEKWRPVWNSYVAEVPTPAELGDPPDRTVCSTALGVLRERSGEVTPTPDQAIDGVVSEWISVAEELLFECPPSSTKIPDLESAYAELFRLQAEIDVVLEIDETGT